MFRWRGNTLLNWSYLLFLLTGTLTPGFAQFASNRYALILEDDPVSAKFPSHAAVEPAEARDYRQQIEVRQAEIKSELASRKVQVTGSVTNLLNAVFVAASKDRVNELKSIPGVKAVVPLRRRYPSLNRATQLLNAPAAWNALGGPQNAGKGIKIAILDSGIDQTHPGFQDASLSMPAGYPICSGSDCAFTNNKVIVARSYVRTLAAGSNPNNPAPDSRPDDYSARDRSGHGTAVAMCAAGNTNSGVVSITGMAPKAYLGNYKIYGSPEVNDGATDDVIIQALEDAWTKDHMDVVSLSSGGPAFTGALDTGAVCGNPAGVACDPLAQAFENAAQQGLIAVVAAGNAGQDGNQYPTWNDISSPGNAPSVIAAGAITNSHFFAETVSIPGGPGNLQNIATDSGDALIPVGALTERLADVTKIGNDGFACTALPAASLVASIALIERGPSTNPACTFAVKVGNAVDAGAMGVILYMSDQSALISPGGLSSFNIPVVMVSNTAGVALKSYADANPGHSVTIDGAAEEQDATSFGNQLAGFSSRGPSIADGGIKPDLVAVGTSVYMAAENYDPLGDVYSANRYGAADGTSFATPMISGAAAMVKQAHPNFTGADVKSALVDTAAQDVTTDDSGNAVDVQSLGGGKLDAGAAVAATVTAVPATVSFGVVKSGSLPKSIQLQINNRGTSSVNLAIAVANNQTTGATVTADKPNLTLAAGASSLINVKLDGNVPVAGSYSGAVTITATGISLRVPYLYLVGNGAAANIIPLSGTSFDGTVNGGIPDGFISFKLVDSFGVPVAGVPVTFTSKGGGTLQSPDAKTDINGIAGATPVLGATPGDYSFTATAGGLSTTFSGTARLVPTIAANGIVNGASFDNNPVAPGSYVSIFGTGLSDSIGYTNTAILPLAINFVNVSFDVPAAGISVPGHLIFVSSNQVNVQVPWELQGQSSAQVKVTIDFSNGNVVNLPLSDYAPAFFEINGGMAAALDSNNKVIGVNHPAQRGQVVQLYANGLGPVSNQPATGDPAPASPFAKTTTTPIVTIGGQSASVSFSGLAPGFAGLYQINATVPANIATGAQSITVAIGGKTSKAANIVVQ